MVSAAPGTDHTKAEGLQGASETSYSILRQRGESNLTSKQLVLLCALRPFGLLCFQHVVIVAEKNVAGQTRTTSRRFAQRRTCVHFVVSVSHEQAVLQTTAHQSVQRKGCTEVSRSGHVASRCTQACLRTSCVNVAKQCLGRAASPNIPCCL